MKLSKESLATRRENISRQIARQRTELAEAYRDLGRPLQYTQVGIKGLQMLRQNAWLISLSPSLVGVATSLYGLATGRKKSGSLPSWLPFGKKKATASVKKGVEEEHELSRKASPLIKKWLGHGVSAFRLYRKVRPYLPL
jgi:hypothetical protein